MQQDATHLYDSRVAANKLSTSVLTLDAYIKEGKVHRLYLGKKGGDHAE